MSRIVIPYRPRECFVPYHDNTKRFGVTVAHRRAGKTVARINKLIRKAIECPLLNPKFAYLAPFYVQAKDIAWVYLKHYSAPLISMGGKINESELTVTFPHNNATIRLYGAENAERMRGLYFDGLSVDEAQGIPKKVLTTIILPTLADRGGWLDVSGTPKGWENLLGELVRLARQNPEEWFLQILKASETGIIPESELRQLRALMPDNEYNQEFECSFDAAITGAVYGKQMAQLEMLGRIKPDLYDPKLPVRTLWDLGLDDATAVWFYQQVGNEMRWIDYYENNNEQIQHYAEQVIGHKLIEKIEYDKDGKPYSVFVKGDVIEGLDRRRSYRYADHFGPHDAAHELLAAGGRSIVQQLFEMGIKMRVVNSTSQMNSIEALRKVLQLSWFDADYTKEGVACLKQYQFEFDEDKKVYRSKPRHDWSSHGCDAAEIGGQVWQAQINSAHKPEPKFINSATANDIFWPPASGQSTFERI